MEIQKKRPIKFVLGAQSSTGQSITHGTPKFSQIKSRDGHTKAKIMELKRSRECLFPRWGPCPNAILTFPSLSYNCTCFGNSTIIDKIILDESFHFIDLQFIDTLCKH